MKEMSYEMAMEKAGAEVIAFKEFGSYQGEVGWVTGCYGSCSGCDAFEGEFGYARGRCSTHEYDYSGLNEDCNSCKQAALELDQRYADFGRTYLGTILPQETQEAILKSSISTHQWNYEEEQEILDFVIANR